MREAKQAALGVNIANIAVGNFNRITLELNVDSHFNYSFLF